MFGVQLRRLIDSYQITSMERKQLRKMLKMNDEISEGLKIYDDILLRIKTCTAMDDENLKYKLLKVIELYDKLIQDYNDENRIQYDHVVKMTNEPHYYILFMLHVCKIVNTLVEQRNTILSEIVCRHQ